MIKLITLLLVFSCANHVTQSGGNHTYHYDPEKHYQAEDLRELSQKVVMTSRRDPPQGTLRELFKNGKTSLKRVGIVVFESEIQPTRSGLAGEDKVYVSEAGKQLITEKLLSIWDEVFKLEAKDIEYVPISRIKKSTELPKFGMSVEDLILSKRESLGPDDIFFLAKGKKTTLKTVLNPRGFRDLSLLLVPAHELMSGPKWSEHQKHFVNDLSKELNLDAVIIIFSKLNWTAARVDKHSGEFFNDRLNVHSTASVLVPLSKYRESSLKLGLKDPPNVTLCFGTYASQLQMELNLNDGLKNNFDKIESKILNPMFKSYTDMTVMMINRLSDDLQGTF